MHALTQICVEKGFPISMLKGIKRKEVRRKRSISQDHITIENVDMCDIPRKQKPCKNTLQEIFVPKIQ